MAELATKYFDDSSRKPAFHRAKALEAYSELIRALYLSKLLFRVGAEPIQV